MDGYGRAIDLRRAGLLIPLALIVGGCANAVPKRPTDPTPTGITLRADVATSSGTELTYWFDYGKTAAYGSSTPRRVADELWSYSAEVSEPVTGLSPDTTYHYRACAFDDEESPPRVNCSKDFTFATVGDTVSGGGTVHFPTGTGPGRLVAEVDFRDIRSGSAGENPGGVLRVIANGGFLDLEVTCLRLEGTRFTIGSRLANAPDERRTYRFFDVTDPAHATTRTLPVGDGDPWACPAPSTGLPGDHNFVPGSGFALDDAP